jgi:lipopolysaccharide transport system ATP-binding protein
MANFVEKKGSSDPVARIAAGIDDSRSTLHDSPVKRTNPTPQEVIVLQTLPQVLHRYPVPKVEPTWPTVLHVTHPKSGSQWVRNILTQCAPERTVTPEYGLGHFFRGPIQTGKIYPTVYVTRQEFMRVPLPPGARRFVVIRDLRDTLVSWYFSVKVSHADDVPVIAEFRARLRGLSVEDGLLWAIHESPDIAHIAAIQRSWWESGEPLVRYEDLLEHDDEILARVLLDECGLPLPRARLQAIIRRCRFEALTGRARGQEDVYSHERKGIAGDWRNHFTDRVRSAFKARFGKLLIATGYTSDGRW